MKRILLAWAAAICAVTPAGAQGWAKARLESSPRHQEWVEVKHDGRTVQCFVVYPEVKDKAPVILVTARSEPRILAQAAASGAVCLLKKPFSANSLLACLRKAQVA